MSQRTGVRGRVGITGRCVGALVATLLSGACAGPTTRTESVGVAQEAVGEAGAASLSDEFDLDHTPLVERATDCPQVAFGTTSYLVMHAERVDALHSYWRELTATRFDRSGGKLDTFGIPGAFTDSTNGCAPLVFTGTTFMTLWSTGGVLRCARITQDGSLLDVGGVSTGLSGSELDGATFDGAHVLASMTDGTVALVGTDCSGIGATVSLPATIGARRWPGGAAAFDGTQYWIAYSETMNGAADRFLVQAVARSGSPSGAPVTVATSAWTRTPTSASYLPSVQGSIASGGGKTAVAYSSQYKDGMPFLDLRYAEISSSGVVGNDTSLNSTSLVDPKIGFAGDGFLLVSSSGATPLLKRHDDGTTLLRALNDLSGASTPSFANDGTNVLLARAASLLQPGPAGPVPTSQARLFGGDLQPLAAGMVLQQMAAGHRSTTVASGAQVSLSVWRGPDGFFSGSRLSANAAVLDDPWLSIHLLTSEAATDPVVASNGTDFLVGWGESKPGSGYTARTDAELVNGTGAVGTSFVVSEGTNPLSYYPYGYAPAVASNGSDYLMVWVHGDGISDPDLRFRFWVEAARITNTGSVLDDPPLILRSFSVPYTGENSGGYIGEVGVAYDGAEYVVVSHVVPPAVASAPLVVQRVFADGSVGTPIDTPWNGDLPGISGDSPAIVWGANQGLVTFVRGTTVFAGRLSAALEPLDVPGLVVTDHRVFPSDGWGVSTAWDGLTYWVSWKDGRRAEYAADDFYTARVSTDGVVLDPSGVLLSQSDPGGHQIAPANGVLGVDSCVLASGRGRVLAAYTRYNPAPEVFDFALRGRWLSNPSATAGAGGSSPGDAGGSGGSSPGDAGGSGGSSPGLGGTGGAAGTGSGAGTDSQASGASAGDSGSAGNATSANAGAASASDGAHGGGSGKGGTATSGGGMTAMGSGGSSGTPSPSGCTFRVIAPNGSARFSALLVAALGLPLLRRARRRG